MEVVASLSQGRTAAAQCGLFTHKSVPVIFEPPCSIQTHKLCTSALQIRNYLTNLPRKKKKFRYKFFDGKNKGKIFPIRYFAYSGSGGITPLIFNLGSGLT